MFVEFNVENLETFVDTLEKKLASNKERINVLLAQEEHTYMNFLRPLQDIDEELEVFFTPLSHLNSVNNNEEIQEVYSKSLPLLSAYGTEVSQDERIFNVLKTIQAKEENTLNQEQRQVLAHNIRDFELSGASLEEAKKQRLKELNIRLSELSNNFSQNLLDATNAYERVVEDEADVEGIPSSDLANLKEEVDGKSIYKFTLQMPSYIAYMTYGPNRAIREEMYKAYTSRAPQNAEVIDEILRLKDEKVKLLGFNSYAEYSIATKMASTTDEVLNFLENLRTNSYEQAKKEIDAIKEMAHEEGLENELKSFDTAFYSDILKKKKYDIDEELYRPYFEQDSVIKGLFNFLEKLFGMRFEQVQAKTWHEKVKVFDIYEGKKLLSRLYLDLEARKSKRGGAWMNNWQSHKRDSQNNEHLASAFVVCNFPPSTKEHKSLLRHDDVVTLFHEMGHAIHHLFSRVNEGFVSGIAGVEWDAVEFPSQFLENFAYEKEVLQIFAKHYETGEILPDTMIEKLNRTKNFQSALAMLRQLEFGIFDFKLHNNLHQGKEVQALLDDVRKGTALLEVPEYNKFQNGFAHIFGGGYAAGYYSYKWAEVLSADAFYAFVDHGLFNQDIATRYKEVVLGKGGSQSMKELFYEFMQRDLDTNSLLRLNGISHA